MNGSIELTRISEAGREQGGRRREGRRSRPARPRRPGVALGLAVAAERPAGLVNWKTSESDVADDEEERDEDGLLPASPASRRPRGGEDRGHEQPDGGQDQERRVGAGDPALNVWIPWRSPPTRTLAPRTSSRLPMIEPGDRGLDDVDEAGLEGEERDDQLGDVAERRVEDAADLGPGHRAEALRGETDDPGEAEDGDRRDDEHDGPSGRGRGRGPTASADEPDRDERPGSARRAPGRRGLGDRGSGEAGGWPAGRGGGESCPSNGARTGAGAGARSPPRRAGQPRRAPCPTATSALDPRRGRRASPASSAAAAARVPPPPAHDDRRPRRAPGSRRRRPAPRARRAAPDDRLVELRELPADGAGRSSPHAGKVAERRGNATGRLEQDGPTFVGGDARRAAPGAPARSAAGSPRRTSAARRSPPRRPPRAPPKRPGSARPARPRPPRPRRGPRPGRDTPGVPASVTSARSAPPRGARASSRARAGPLRAWKLTPGLDAVAGEQPAA